MIAFLDRLDKVGLYHKKKFSQVLLGSDPDYVKYTSSFYQHPDLIWRKALKTYGKAAFCRSFDAFLNARLKKSTLF